MRANHWAIRSAKPSDRTSISILLSTAVWKHQHLDWTNALDLLGENSFMLALEGNTPVACLACPPDPPLVAWLRLFAVIDDQHASRLWDLLWLEAAAQSVAAGATQAAALLSEDWLVPILLRCGFEHTNDVILLEWCQEVPPSLPAFEGKLRPMHLDDLKIVVHVDQRSFGLLWRYSLKTLHEVFKQAAIATVIEFDGKPVAYQVSTTSAHSAHLARLAVDPEWQGRGLGKTLVADALRRFAHRGIHRVSVNTQVDNEKSLQLYRTLGFYQIGRLYPVYQYKLHT